MSDHDDGLEVDLGSIETEIEQNHTGVDAEEATEETSNESTEDTSADASGYVETDDPKVKARLGQMTREKWEAIRAKEKVERELQTLRQELSTLKAPRPVDPPSADLAIDDPVQFRSQQEKYAAYIKDQAVHESEKAKATKEIEDRQQADTQTHIANYSKRAAELKIPAKELTDASNLVGNSGIKPEVCEYLIKHKNGPAIVTQLANRPDDLYHLATMNPIEAAVEIERLFGAIKTTTKNDPPPPPTRINGSRTSGVRAADGTTYE